MNTTQSPSPVDDASPKICEVNGGGLLLPLFGNNEQNWPLALRDVLYLLGLLWSFVAVAIIADLFMGAIERITAKEEVVHIEHGGEKRRFHTRVWNYTVANLTLMALGSSAPEILLSIIELLNNQMYSGDLGPSAIVGSAAFNLLVISAVCVACIPSPDIKYIKQMGVFAVTGITSVFAYLWLIIILQISSPDYIDVWEAAVTFAMFPVLVLVAYFFDIGLPQKLSKKVLQAEELSEVSVPKAAKQGQVVPITDKPAGGKAGEKFRLEETIAERMKQLKRETDTSMNDFQLRNIASEIEGEMPKSRAMYRIAATRTMMAGARMRRANEKTEQRQIAEKPEEPESAQPRASDSGDLKRNGPPSIGFTAPQVKMFLHAQDFKVNVQRHGSLAECVSVQYTCEDTETTVGSGHFAQFKGTLTLQAGEAQKAIILSPPEDRKARGFSVTLSDPAWVKPPRSEEARMIDSERTTAGTSISPIPLGSSESHSAQSACGLGIARVEVTLVDEEDPGTVRFEKDAYEVKESSGDLVIKVLRLGNPSTEVSMKYLTEDDTAVAGKDYEAVEGTLTLLPGEKEGNIVIPIINDEHYEKAEAFRVILTEPERGLKFDETTDGGAERCIAIVTIQCDDVVKNNVDKILAYVNTHAIQVGANSWAQQFVEAVYCNGSPEAQKEAGVMDWIMHIISFVWKLLFAFVPPPSILGGWLSFFIALVFIAVLTAIIGDLASLLGCCLGLPDLVTAITLVAIGTSLPDTFASQMAAKDLPHADAAIGNITGSNAVNVFLGLGTPWLMGAIYWTIKGPTDDWKQRFSTAGKYGQYDIVNRYPQGGFAVPAGDLVFSVIVFSICAVICLGTLVVRRKLYGGELGGPTVPKYITVALFLMLWLTYITLSVLKATIPGFIY
jgi:solute carrier family 8 (sodium/calcium exchanger)